MSTVVEIACYTAIASFGFSALLLTLTVLIDLRGWRRDIRQAQRIDEVRQLEQLWNYPGPDSFDFYMDRRLRP